VELLTSPIRNYAWGSNSAIAAVQGRLVPSLEPEAELWMGAHPASPSLLSAGGALVPLDVAVAGAAGPMLGDAVVARHGARLPFLLKLLAADAPLSLQVHPDAAQALAGFEAAERSGPLLGDPMRSYVDRYHKPELLSAVSEFHGLCGFRPVDETLALLEPLEAPLLRPFLDRLRASPDAAGLRGTVNDLLTLPTDDGAALVAEVVRAAEVNGPSLAVELGARYPGDVGVIVALLLNRIVLSPGESMFLAAGVMHAYLHGLGVEVMAASDNVIRGGLTGKHVDVVELLRLVDFTPGPAVPLAPERPGPGVLVWRPPVDEFVLARVDLATAGGSVTRTASGPRIVFCLSGAVSVDDGAGPEPLPAGQAGFVRAGNAHLALTGDGIAYEVTTGSNARFRPL
jgi:mannose-6-phosphate isomerase